ncbi:metallophosphoesterase [bacterium]|nr:metallophosphoesterase [bacterium]
MAHRLKLAVIGDPHLALPRGDPDRRLEVDPGRKLHGLSAELLQATIDEVNASPGIDAVLLLGDLTRDSELFNHEAALMLLKKINAPLYIILGNHDMLRQRPQGVSYPDEPHLDRHEVADMYRHCGLPGGKTRYVVELPGDVALVVLDSNRSLEELDAAGEDISRQDHGWVGGKQLGWLDEVLGRIRAGGRLSLVAVHHSVTDHSPAEQPGHLLHPLCEQWQLHDSSAARQCLARHRVPLVLSGHLHAQSFNVQDNVANLVTSATVSYPHAWRLLSIAYGRTDRLGMSSLASAERAILVNNHKEAIAFAQRADNLLPAGTPGQLRAQDIEFAAKQALSKR